MPRGAEVGTDTDKHAADRRHRRRRCRFHRAELGGIFPHDASLGSGRDGVASALGAEF